MSRELVCADGELSMALNKTERYIEFLDNCIREYNKIIAETAGNGIEDVLICTQLAQLSGWLSEVKRELDTVLPEISDSVSREIQDIEDADNFTYPDISFGDIMSTLAGFL
uniref:hypothetical protein n=1 Tax=Lachnoclostridium phocaeense TaxID=1871021 RepID=UPI0026DDB013|nr:hypothetical protein [Lachnoclostridium phocaeense]